MTHWRTTLIGIGLAALNAYVNGFHWQNAALSAAIAAAGILAHDPTWLGGPPVVGGK